MSLKPQLYTIDTFDARKGTTIKFIWQGEKLKSNQLVFYNSSGNQLDYSPVYTSFKGIHEIPPNTVAGGTSALVNAQKYGVKVIVTTQSNETFESDIKYFRTVLTPEFSFTGVQDGYVVNGSSITLQVHYYSEQGEKLNTWRAYLYDSARYQISMSEEKYASKSLNALFSGLDSLTEYYVRAIGSTVNGLAIDTGYIRIRVNYQMPELFLNLSLSNRELEGGVYIDSEIIAIDGVVEGDERYINNERGELSVIDLRNSRVTYSQGFNFDEDFTMRINASFNGLPHGLPFIVLKGSRIINRIPVENTITLYNHVTTVTNKQGEDTFQHQVYMEVKNSYDGNDTNVFKFGLWSNPLSGNQVNACHEHIGIILKRTGHIYDLTIIPLADYQPS